MTAFRPLPAQATPSAGESIAGVRPSGGKRPAKDGTSTDELSRARHTFTLACALLASIGSVGAEEIQDTVAATHFTLPPRPPAAVGTSGEDVQFSLSPCFGHGGTSVTAPGPEAGPAFSGFTGPARELSGQRVDPRIGGGCGPGAAGRRWWLPAFVPYCQGDPDHPLRHVGRGHPLEGTSWLNRPWHADAFLGGIFPDSLTHVVTQDEDYIWGLRLGKDFDHYWGWEVRMAFAQPSAVQFPAGVIRGNSTLYFYDVDLLFYPWGDARWRPYLTAGLGLANVRFNDEQDRRYAEALLHVPFGLGLKYQLQRWLALRVDLMDDFVIGSAGVRTMHNYTITGGFEVRYGFRRRRYYPYQ
jgi:hypothetical protein